MDAPTRRRTVLVTDGEQRAALAVVRSLGRAGHEVVVVSSRPRSIAGGSRFARREFLVPDPASDAAAYVEALSAAVRCSGGVDVLLPISEASLLAVLPARERFAGVSIPFPSAEVFRRVCDKAAVLREAAAVGIATPRQVEVANRHQAAGLDELRYPVAVKASRSLVSAGEGLRKTGVEYAPGPRSLGSLLERLPAEAFPVLVQERVSGPGIGIFLLRRDGESLAVFAHRRIREKPPTGGVSVYRESVPADPGLVRRSEALLDRFGWNGVAMVEYKLDAATGTPYLMEINGRFWGSLQLAVDAGVDFPSLLVAADAGAPVPPVVEYRTGVRSRWWWGDVDQLLIRFRADGTPPGSPGPDTTDGRSEGARGRSVRRDRARALREFLTYRASDRWEVLRLRDPSPFLRETVQWFGALRSSRAAGSGGGRTATASPPASVSVDAPRSAPSSTTAPPPCGEDPDEASVVEGRPA